VVQRINRQPTEGTEIISSYEIRAVCRDEVEERMVVFVHSGLCREL
jgi:hypothetical protein